MPFGAAARGPGFVVPARRSVWTSTCNANTYQHGDYTAAEGREIDLMAAMVDAMQHHGGPHRRLMNEGCWEPRHRPRCRKGVRRLLIVTVAVALPLIPAAAQAGGPLAEKPEHECSTAPVPIDEIPAAVAKMLGTGPRVGVAGALWTFWDPSLGAS